MEWEPTPDDGTGSGFTLTHGLLCVIAIIGLVILYQVTRLPEGHPYAKCQRIIGMDGACEAKVAGQLMMRGF